MRNYCIIVKEGGAIIKQRYVFTEWSSDPYRTIGKLSTHWKEREASSEQWIRFLVVMRG